MSGQAARFSEKSSENWAAYFLGTDCLKFGLFEAIAAAELLIRDKHALKIPSGAELFGILVEERITIDNNQFVLRICPSSFLPWQRADEDRGDFGFFQ